MHRSCKTSTFEIRQHLLERCQIIFYIYYLKYKLVERKKEKDGDEFYCLRQVILLRGNLSNKMNPAARSMLSSGTMKLLNGTPLSIGALGNTYEQIEYEPFFSHRATLKKCVGTATCCEPITSYLTYNLPSTSRLFLKKQTIFFYLFLCFRFLYVKEREKVYLGKQSGPVQIQTLSNRLVNARISRSRSFHLSRLKPTPT